MNDQEFREHILTFIAKSEQWMQDASKKLDVIEDLQQQVSSMRDKLKGARASETVAIADLGEQSDSPSAELAADETRDAVDTSEETEETDPLLALAGTLKWDDIGAPDTLSLPEIRVVKGAHEDHPDPLIALAGTLQSDVTDLGERHDDYIAAASLAELRGDDDE